MNPRHQRFIEEYLVDLNATRAYRAAYPNASQATADTNGPKLLGNTRIAEAIQKAQAKRAEKAQVTAEQVLLGLRDEAMRFGEGSTHSARVQAWGLLARHLGLFADRLHITGQVQTSAPAPDFSKLTYEQRQQLIDGLQLALGGASPPSS